MLLTLDKRDWHGEPLDNVATGEDGERYFFENGLWQKDGKRAKQWRALLTSFRRSDWYSHNGFHISGCRCNQYLVTECKPECGTLQQLLYDEYGGFPDNFDPGKDERNQYRSSVESYG
jgi:hypothetical protein